MKTSAVIDEILSPTAGSFPALRTVGSGYSAGKLERESVDWNPVYGTRAEEEMSADFELLTARSRWLARNNELCGGAMDKIVNKTLGANGIQTWADAEDAAGNSIDAFNDRADDVIKWFNFDGNA